MLLRYMLHIAHDVDYLSGGWCCDDLEKRNTTSRFPSLTHQVSNHSVGPSPRDPRAMPTNSRLPPHLPLKAPNHLRLRHIHLHPS